MIAYTQLIGVGQRSGRTEEVKQELCSNAPASMPTSLNEPQRA